MTTDRSPSDRVQRTPRPAGRTGAAARTGTGEHRTLIETLLNQLSGQLDVADAAARDEDAAPRPAPRTAVPARPRGLEITGLYIISVAARLTDLHPQTLRKYERFGLITPSRTGGSLRLYSEQDLARLRLIRNLVDNYGLNLAGVRLIMDLVLQLHHLLGQLESNDEFLRTTEGKQARAELAGVLAALEAG